MNLEERIGFAMLGMCQAILRSGNHIHITYTIMQIGG